MRETSVLSLARPEILALRPYVSARSLNTQGKIFLDANESPTSPLPDSPFNRYPEPQPHLLLERFSHLYDIPPSQLLITRGSDEAIDLLIRTFCEPKRDQVLICPPTYGMYKISAQIQGAQIVRVPLQLSGGEFNLDENGISSALSEYHSIKIIFLCSPNNPTGTAFGPDILNRICENTQNRCLVVIDEAYSEFQEEGSMMRALDRFPHLVILRTLSKAWALAGARCGVTVAQEPVIQLLNKIRPPYPLSTPTIEAVLAATDHQHQTLLHQKIQEIKTERENVKNALLEIPFVKWIYPSSTNFLLVKMENARSIFQSIHAKGIILRDRSSEPGLEGCIRITIGTPVENQILISTLRSITEENRK